MGKVMALLPLLESDEYRGGAGRPRRADRLLDRRRRRSDRQGALVVRVGEVVEGDLARLGEHERGVVARLEAAGVEAVDGGEGVGRVALVDEAG